MHRNPAMLYFFALNKSKTIQFYYSSPIIEIGITYMAQPVKLTFIFFKQNFSRKQYPCSLQNTRKQTNNSLRIGNDTNIYYICDL